MSQLGSNGGVERLCAMNCKRKPTKSAVQGCCEMLKRMGRNRWTIPSTLSIAPDSLYCSSNNGSGPIEMDALAGVAFPLKSLVVLKPLAE